MAVDGLKLMHANPNLLRTIAEAFRKGFISTDLSNAPGFLPDFPCGCCHWGSYMIGHFLKYEQCLEPLEVIGERFATDGMECHSWLTVDGIIIDITSDEFSDSQEPVIVDQSSYWHGKWEVIQTNTIQKIETYDSGGFKGQMRAAEVYEQVVAEARQILGHERCDNS